MNPYIDMLQKLIQSNPQAMFESLMKTNPQFKKFVEDNQGKTPEQIAKENRIDWALLKRYLN